MYYDLSDALDELSVDQVKVTVGEHDNHTISLTGLCTDGLLTFLTHIVREWDLNGESLVSMVPQLENLSAMDVLPLLLRQNGGDFGLFDLLSEARSKSSATSSGISVGDKFVHTRKVIEVTPTHVTYEDDDGNLSVVQKSSFRSWAKNKRKS